MISVRPAAVVDIDRTTAVHHSVKPGPKRTALIRRRIETGDCFVAEADGRLVGYLLIQREFFDHWFIELLFTATDVRRRGVASSLIEYCEDRCESSKLFVSTNLSNVAMQGLLAKRQFKLAGVINDLDDADPELIFHKLVAAS